MKSFNQIFNLVSIDEINSLLEQTIGEHENLRNKIRKEVLEEMESSDVKSEGEKIQKLLTQMNKDLSESYEKEIFLRDFVNKLLSK